MSTERRLFALLRPYRGLFALALAAAFAAAVLDGATLVVLIPLLRHLFGTSGALHAGSTRLEELVERLTAPITAGASSGEAAGRLVVLLVAALLLKNLMGYAASQLNVRMQENVVRDLRRRLFAHLLRLDLAYFQRTRAGQVISTLVTEVDQTKNVVTASLASLFQNRVLVLTTLFVLTQTSWRLTLLALAVVPLLVLAVQALLRRLRTHAKARAQERADITATVTERTGAVRLIRAAGTEALEAREFDRQVERYRKKVIRTQRFSSLTGPVSEIFAGLMVILVIWAGTRPALVGLPAALAPEAIIVFLMAALRLTSPLKAMTQFPAQMALATASAERVFALLDEPAAELERPGEESATFTRDLVFDRVTFRYGDDPPVLREVSFRVARGQVVALVGPSGAGKTTLMDLVPRFHDPSAGRILLDGVPLTRLTRRSIRGLLGVVGQETVLLHDTVHANIAYGVPDATRERVEQAARAANAEEFILALPERYDTLLGERGTRLSGGQRQRIAIARALLRDPPILILDEATSALDTESERLVQEAIERLMRDRTVLVIAHRLATVRHADRILVLDQGRLVEQGTHDELLRAGGLYRRLHDLQFRDARTPGGAPAEVG